MTENESLARLLVWQAGRYTSDSSMPAETALALLDGLRYTLSMAPPGLADADDMQAAWRAGQKRIERELLRFRQLYSAACLGAMDFGSISYRDTLRSIGGFPRRYDRLYFPQLVECDVDYQLCLPVSEDLLGVSYVNGYLRRINIENAFLSRFPPDAVHSALARARGDYRGLLINLYEPVAADALALCLIDRDPFSITITPEARAELTEKLVVMTASARAAALAQAAGRFAGRLALTPAQAGYLAETARELEPRIAASVDSGLVGVFA